MQTIVLANEDIISNVEFADTNFIDGRLTIGLKEFNSVIMSELLSKFFDTGATHSITLKNNEEVYNTWNGYTKLSNVFMNFDVGTLTIWLRKE